MRWVTLLFRTILTWTVGVIVTIVGAIAVITIVVFRPTSPAIDSVIQWWSRMWLLASGTKLVVEGRENIDPDRSYVVVANHVSNLDVTRRLAPAPAR